MSEPFPKSVQLAAHRKRYRRFVASRKQWEKIAAEKGGPCRVCTLHSGLALDLHHLVLREDGGDDVAANLVPVCRACHDALHRRAEAVARLLLSKLSDAEYAYMIQRGGEDYPERVYGVEYGRQA